MNEGSVKASIARSVAAIRARSGLEPRVGLVLGSGLGALADALELETELAYGEIGFPVSTVVGHAGRLCLGRLDGVPVAVMRGRIHLYEGHPVADVVLPVRVLVGLGAKSLVITNAAGGIDPSFLVGDLMLIRDHLNLTGTNALVGPNDESLGPRFPDMSFAYDPKAIAMAKQVASERGITVREGVYAGLLGPSYETPAEIRMLRALGADAVGMSTVLEVIAARHMGARVVGISCISNKAAGLSSELLTHAEVQATADAIQGSLLSLVRGIVGGLGMS
ncbi:MAG: purine-nucleoside phosphorylase [Deltaproteobacteria bacterium]|nr:purine-nucleoside phosphorylase [Deltaproteobacteria bacterium]